MGTAEDESYKNRFSNRLHRPDPYSFLRAPHVLRDQLHPYLAPFQRPKGPRAYGAGGADRRGSVKATGSAVRGSTAPRQRRGRRSPRDSQRRDAVTPRIVVIDGEAAARDLLKMLLTKKGFRVSVTASPRRGLRMLMAEKPDLIILNLTTSGADGLDALRAVKAYDEMTPVIVTVTPANIRLAREGVRLGAFDYVMKPFDPGYVDALVDSALQNWLTIA